MNLMRIDKLFDFEKGSLQSSKCVAGNYNFITASADWKTHSEYTHDTEALVFAAAASGSLGRTHYVNGKFIASDLCFILSSKDPINLPIDLQFYHIIFNELRNNIVKNTKSGTSKEAIGLASFGKYEIPYLDIIKQTVIKNRLVASEATKEKLSSEHTYQLDLLKKLRQQILHDAVQGKLVPQDPNDEPASKLLERIKAEKEKLVKEKKIKKEKPLSEIIPEEIPFGIPEKWMWCRMGEICTKITDGTHHSPTNIEIGEYKYVTAKNIKDSGIDLSNITYVSKDVHNMIYARCNPEIGDILYIKDGATTGIVTINNLSEPFSMLSSVALLKLPKVFSNKFLMFAMRSPYFYNATRNDMFGVAITRVTLEKIQCSLIVVPPISEQNRIISKIEQLMKLCDELEQSIKQNQKFTQELLQVALKEALEPEKTN